MVFILPDQTRPAAAKEKRKRFKNNITGGTKNSNGKVNGTKNFKLVLADNELWLVGVIKRTRFPRLSVAHLAGAAGNL